LDLTRGAAARSSRQAGLLAATWGIHLDLYLNGYDHPPERLLPECNQRQRRDGRRALDRQRRDGEDLNSLIPAKSGY